MKRRYILLLVVSALLFTLIVEFPVRALALVQPQILKHGSIGGTLLNGHISQPQRLAPYVESLTWRWRPSALFTAKLSADMNAEGPQLNLHGNGDIGLGGRIQLSNIQGTADAGLLNNHPMLALANISGALELQNIEMELENNWPLSADGIINWSAAKVDGFFSVDFGQILAELSSSDDGVIQAKLSNSGGELTLTGLAKINRDREWSFDATIAIQNNVNPPLEGILGNIASRNVDGSYRLFYEGKL